MIILKREFMDVEGRLYEIIRVIKESHGPVIDTWKEHLMCDKVFRKDGLLYFCRIVTDVQEEN